MFGHGLISIDIYFKKNKTIVLKCLECFIGGEMCFCKTWP